jgi:hypothetical protein
MASEWAIPPYPGVFGCCLEDMRPDGEDIPVTDPAEVAEYLEV